MTCSTNTCITYVHAKWHTDSMWWTDNQLVLLSHSLSFEQTRVSHRKRNRNRKVKMNLMEKQKSKGISTLKKNNYYSYKNITRGSPQNNVITTSCRWKKSRQSLQIYCVCACVEVDKGGSRILQKGQGSKKNFGTSGLCLCLLVVAFPNSCVVHVT